MLIFSHYFYLQTFVIPHLVALYVTYREHQLSPLIFKPPQDCIIIPILLMRLLCDTERTSSMYNSTVSLLLIISRFNGLSLHQDYRHFVFKDLILCYSTLLIQYPIFSIITFSKKLVALNIKTAFCVNYVWSF